jgi:hypothetical protein
MDKLNWIRDLVKSEQEMEEAGVVDFSAGFNPQTELEEATLDFMNDLKTAFIEAASAFNQLRGSAFGNIKIYGISKTQADFMLFRNGHKLIFSVREPGLIQLSHSAVATQYIPGQGPQASSVSQESLQAHWGAFGELRWTYHEQPINLDYLVRFYLSRFARDSAK